MYKQEFIELLSRKIKLIRNEAGYSQEKMAEVLSISKKTLVEIEKGRSMLTFCAAVAAVVIFEDTETVQITLGGDVNDSVKSLALEHYENLPKTMGGKIWWRELCASKGYIIQKNIISAHFRILNEKNERVCSSFNQDYINARFDELSGKQIDIPPDDSI